VSARPVLPRKCDSVRLCQHPSDSRFALLRARCERPGSRAAEKRDELAALHVWMAPAWQEITSRAAQKSLAVMCSASHDGFSVKGCFR
jgi:hypothetical protein